MRKQRPSSKEQRITKSGLASGETEKQEDKLWGFGRKETHTHTNTSHPSSQKMQCLSLVNAISPSAFRRYQPQQVTPEVLPESLCSPVLTVSTHSARHKHFYRQIALDSENQRAATASSCKACFCDLSLPSVYMGRMECHRAYPMRYSWLKQLCKASLKTCLSHVCVSCSYLNYHLEILNSSLPHFSIKNKTATKQLGKTYLTWHVPCLTHLTPTQSRDPILTLIPTHKQGTQGEEGQNIWNSMNSIQTTILLLQRKRTQGTQQSSGWWTSLWYYKGKVSSPKCLSEESHLSLGSILTSSR